MPVDWSVSGHNALYRRDGELEQVYLPTREEVLHMNHHDDGAVTDLSGGIYADEERVWIMRPGDKRACHTRLSLIETIFHFCAECGCDNTPPDDYLCGGCRGNLS